VQPHDRSSHFSLLYRFRSLSRDFEAQGISLLKHGGMEEAGGPHGQVRELIQAIELRADLRLHDRWALLLAVPVVNTYQSVDGYLHYDAYGLGDPFAILRYQLVNTKRGVDDNTSGLIHRLQLGAGVKMPFGRSDVTYHGQRLHPDAQPGTGSWDALLSLEYALRAGRNGMLITSVGRINTADKYGVRLGHAISTALELFHAFNLGGTAQVLPSLGAYYEHTGHDDVEG
jgi:hypothetical protein